MKSRLVTVSSLIVAIIGLAQVAQAQEVKFGLVDFAKCQKHHYKTHLKRDEFDSKRKEEGSKVDAKKAQLKELVQKQQDAQKQLQDPTLSDTRKKEILKEAQERQGQMTSLQREIIENESTTNAELGKYANEIQKSLTGEVHTTIVEVSEAKGMHLVVNKTFGINGVPTIAHSDSKVIEDITDEVIAKLNSTAPADYKVPEE